MDIAVEPSLSPLRAPCPLSLSTPEPVYRPLLYCIVSPHQSIVLIVDGMCWNGRRSQRDKTLSGAHRT